jgi:hypothetical protein
MQNAEDRMPNAAYMTSGRKQERAAVDAMGR